MLDFELTQGEPDDARAIAEVWQESRVVSLPFLPVLHTLEEIVYRNSFSYFNKHARPFHSPCFLADLYLIVQCDQAGLQRMTCHVNSHDLGQARRFEPFVGIVLCEHAGR